MTLSLLLPKISAQLTGLVRFLRQPAKRPFGCISERGYQRSRNLRRMQARKPFTNVTDTNGLRMLLKSVILPLRVMPI